MFKVICKFHSSCIPCYFEGISTPFILNMLQMNEMYHVCDTVQKEDGTYYILVEFGNDVACHKDLFDIINEVTEDIECEVVETTFHTSDLSS